MQSHIKNVKASLFVRLYDIYFIQKYFPELLHAWGGHSTVYHLGVEIVRLIRQLYSQDNKISNWMGI